MSTTRTRPARTAGRAMAVLAALGLPLAGHAQALYVANSGNASIAEFDLTSGSLIATFQNIPQPRGMAFDGAGNLYIANNAEAGGAAYNSLTEITRNGVVNANPFPSLSLNLPEGLAFGGNGNLYVANSGAGSISVLDPTSGATVRTITSALFSKPEGLAFDAAGNLFLSNAGNNSIDMIAPDLTVSVYADNSTDPSHPFNNPKGLAFDGQGNLFVANYGNPNVPGTPGTTYNDTVYEIAKAGKSISTVASGLNGAFGLAVDASGALYVDNGDHNHNDAQYTWPVDKIAGGTTSVFASGKPFFAGPVLYPTYLAVGPQIVSAPVPETSTTVSFGLLLVLGGAGVAVRRKRRQAGG